MSSDDENFGGYYNSVGSKEGWAPQSFRSSRKSRAQVKQQSISDFLDEDEKQDLDEKQLKQEIFGTFGFTATELARKQADQKEQKQRPDELIIVPVVVTESPRVRSKLDTLLFMPDSTSPQMHRGTETTDDVEIQNEEVAVENVERPAVDLYKAIFSDDEEEEKKMTTSGDLLESLGKEIGLVVPPPEMPPPDNNKPFVKIAPKETFHFEKENIETSATNGETPRHKDMQQIDSSKFRKNRDDRNRKRLGSRRRNSSSSESDADNSDDSRRKEKRTSREKRSCKRRSKSHKHTRKDSSSSRSNPRKEHENRKRKRR